MSGNGVETNWENDGGVTLGAVLASQAMHEFTEKLKVIAPSIMSPNASTAQVIFEGMSSDPKAFLDAVGVYIRDFGNAIDVVGDGLAEKDAREDPYDRFARAKSEPKEMIVETSGSVVKTFTDMIGFTASHTGKLIGLMQELDRLEQAGDYDAAVRVKGEIVSAVVGMGMDVVEAGFSGALSAAHEVGEGYNEFNAAVTDAIINGETDLTPVSTDPSGSGSGATNTGGATGTTGSSDAIHSSEVGTSGYQHHESEDSNGGDVMSPSESDSPDRNTEEGSEDDPSEDPGSGAEEPADDPSDEPADAPASGSKDDKDGTGDPKVLVPKEQEEDKEDIGGEHNFDDGREKESDKEVEEADEADADSTSDTDEDTDDSEGYTPGFDDGAGNGQLSAELVAIALGAVSDGLKMYEPGYIAPISGAAAMSFGEAVDQILFDMVSRPNGVDEDPILPDGAELGEIFDTKDIWLPLGEPDVATGEPKIFDQNVDLF